MGIRYKLSSLELPYVALVFQLPYSLSSSEERPDMEDTYSPNLAA